MRDLSSEELGHVYGAGYSAVPSPNSYPKHPHKSKSKSKNKQAHKSKSKSKGKGKRYCA